MKRLINIYSEIFPLKKVMLYRPNDEFLNIIPDNLEHLSIYGISDLESLQKEHDALANILRKEGIDVIYLIDLIVESLNINANIREKFIKQFINEANIKIPNIYKKVYKFLNEIKVNKCIEGIRCSEINLGDDKFFLDNYKNGLIIEPLPKLYLIHEYFFGVLNGASLGHFKNTNCQRETIFIDYVLKYHPKYKNTKLYCNRYNEEFLNGRDLLVLSDEVLCIGVNQYTGDLAAYNFANEILKEKKIKHVIVVKMPTYLEKIHFDEFINMVDHDKFIVNNDLEKIDSIYELSLHNEQIVVNELHMSFDKVLEKYLHLNEIVFIKCANGNIIDSKREEWQQAIGVLCIKPGVVIAYKTNKLTNESLKANGIKVIELNTLELLKGKSGVRSIVMPLIREK